MLRQKEMITSPDGKYYIIERDIPDPDKKRPAVYLFGGERYFTDCFLCSAVDEPVIRGEDIFDDEEKRQLAGIKMRFVSNDVFLAFGIGWRENVMFYVYKISDGKPEFLYRVHGGDCSFLVGTSSFLISGDGKLSVTYENAGSYEEPKEIYMVLRFMGNIIKRYPAEFEGNIYPFNNGRWLEIIKNNASFFEINSESGDKWMETDQIDYNFTDETLVRQFFDLLLRKDEGGV